MPASPCQSIGEQHRESHLHFYDSPSWSTHTHTHTHTAHTQHTHSTKHSTAQHARANAHSSPHAVRTHTRTFSNTAYSSEDEPDILKEAAINRGVMEMATGMEKEEEEEARETNCNYVHASERCTAHSHPPVRCVQTMLKDAY